MDPPADETQEEKDRRENQCREKERRQKERLEPPAESVEMLKEPRLSKKRRYVDISSGPSLPFTSTPSSSSTDIYIWDVVRLFLRLDSFV
jgi:hypothetical protein